MGGRRFKSRSNGSKEKREREQEKGDVGGCEKDIGKGWYKYIVRKREKRRERENVFHIKLNI